MKKTTIRSAFPVFLALAAVPALAGDDAAPLTDLEAAAEAASGGDAGEAGEDEAATSFELTLGWQTRSLTDYWWLDRDADGDSTSSSNLSLAMDHELAEGWTLALLVDAWFDAHDWHWSSSFTDSIAFQAAVRRDLGDGWELEVAARYDDWQQLHASVGDPYSGYAMLTYTFEALGGELSPYVYQECRRYLEGQSHDGTWFTDVGAEYSRELADRWTLDAALYGARVDGSRTDPDVWALGGSVGVSYEVCEGLSTRVFAEATSSRGGDPVPGRTIGFLGFQLVFSF